MKKTLADYWAPRINAEWRKSVQGILNVGRQLIAAREACEHGEFVRLFKGSENAVPDPVPFGIHTADRLMAIAATPAIADCAHAHSLPQSWGTLYELSKLDGDTLTAGIKAGEITPEMTRSQAAALRADPIERIESPVHEVMANAIKNAATKFIGQLTTRAQFAYVLSRLDELAMFISEMQAEAAIAGNETAPASIEPAVVALFDAITVAVRADCLECECAHTLHDHWVTLGEPLFSDFPLCRVRAPWREEHTSDAICDAAAFAAGVQGKPARVFRQLNVAARRINRLLRSHVAAGCPS